MQLFLCEKPSQAKDIARVLGISKREQGFISGGNIVVTWFMPMSQSAWLLPLPASYSRAVFSPGRILLSASFTLASSRADNQSRRTAPL